MATKTRKTTGRKSTKRKPAKKRESAKQREARLRAERQMWAIILFAVGLLLAALTWIPGTDAKLWSGLHEGMFGIFGFAAHLVAPTVLYMAYLLATEEKYKLIKPKAILMTLLMLALCGMLQAGGMGRPQAAGWEAVLEVYEAGIALKGGGLLGAVLGLPLRALCGKIGALIILGLTAFVLLMLIGNITLPQLYHTTVEKPVQKAGQVYTDTVEALASHIPEPRERRRFNIDVPIPDDPVPPQEEQPRPSEQTMESVASGLSRAVSSFFSAGEEPASQKAAEQADDHGISDAMTAVLERMEPTSSAQDEPAAPMEAHTAQAETEHTESPEECAAFAEPEPLEIPEEPDNAYIDEIIRRMATPQPLPKQAPAPEEVGEVPEEEAEAVQQPEVREYVFPSITLLNEPPERSGGVDAEELKENAQRLVDTLQSFGVQTRIIDITRGPAVTRYELQPSAGVKISKITGLADDIALNLASSGVRIEAPIPNKPAVGIEVPNRDVSMVTLREVIDSGAFVEAKSKLTVALGRDIAGNITLADLARMPHVLIAGSTGSGKSVCINSIIMSILYKATDQEVKLLMIDPKVVELGIYNGIPHLLVPVVTDPKKAAGALNWAVGEMLKRYQIFAENNVRDLESYNEMASAHETLPTMPQIVIIIDELSDLMMAAPKDVEDAICRLAQMARAAGMHLVIATQRPSVDVITGIIKANVPSRVAFAVSSQVDSRTILDSGGAEKLLGRGDMLFAPVGSPKPQRVQGCFVSNKEVERVVSFIKEGQAQTYSREVMEEIERSIPAEKGGKSGDNDGGGFEEGDNLIMDAIEMVVEAGQASTSMIQRRLKVGYARAGRLVDEMEQMGIVGPFEGSKPRQVLISKERWYEMKLQQSE